MKLGHQLWKPNSVCQGKFEKYKIQTQKAGPLHRCLWPCCPAAWRTPLARGVNKPDDAKRPPCEKKPVFIRASLQSAIKMKISTLLLLQRITLLTNDYSAKLNGVISLVQETSERHLQLSLPLRNSTALAKAEVLKIPGFLELQRWIPQKSLFKNQNCVRWEPEHSSIFHTKWLII